MISRLAIACFCAAFVVAADAQENVMSLRAIDGRIHSHWSRKYPEEKILNIDFTHRDREYNVGRNGRFLFKEAIVTVEGTGNTRARFRVETHFQAAYGVWRFERVEVERRTP